MANELSALAEAAGEVVDRLAITPAQSLHAAVARRVFANVGAGAAPSRAVHDGISGALYSALRAATVQGSTAAAAAIRRAGGDADVRPMSRSRRGRLAISVANAFIGDRLEERNSDLAIPMAVRRHGADVANTPESLRRAFPHPTPRVAVFLHGLMESEEWWQRGTGRHSGEDRRPFGVRLRADLGLTPVDIRYNTGLHVSENGRRLDDLLQSLVDAWPVGLEDIVLIGHSMGGLVARSACHQALSSDRTWPSLVRHLVTLGTPHTGAPLEKAVHATAWALRALPESRPFADILDSRSAGIRDLRHGYLSDDDWRSEDPTALFDDRRGEVPTLPGCTHTFITATVTRDPSQPLGWLVGDLMVRTESAGGRCRERSIPVPPESVVHVGGLTHFDLLDHPLVYSRMRDALARSFPKG
jgi:pimeloyl-ACP methyl ester carboxylesterase